MCRHCFRAPASDWAWATRGSRVATIAAYVLARGRCFHVVGAL
jgi:hypothetical protein